jgi:TonB family protein
MKKGRIFCLSIMVLFNIARFATDVSYACTDLISRETKVESSLSSGSALSVVKQVDPIYPPLAKAARISGEVVVEVSIDSAGKVSLAKVVSGHPLLKEASSAAACQWEFALTALTDADGKIIGRITFDYSIPGLRKYLEKALANLEKHPGSVDAHAELARAYGINGQAAEALKEYEEVLRLQPDYDENIYAELASLYHPYNEEHDKRLEAYQKGLRVFPNSLRLLEPLGEMLAGTGKYAEASEVYQRALAINPEDVDFLLRTARLYQQLLRFDESLPFLHKVMAIRILAHSDFSTAAELAGYAYLQLGRLDEAEQYLKKTEAPDEDGTASATALESLGDVYQQRGDLELAVQTWKKALTHTYEGSRRARIEEKLKVHSK